MPDWKKIGESKVDLLEVSMIACLVVFGAIIFFGLASQFGTTTEPSKNERTTPQKTEAVADVSRVASANESDFEKGKALYEEWKRDHDLEQESSGRALLRRASKSGKQKLQAKRLLQLWQLESNRYQKKLELEIRESHERERIESYSFTRGNPIQIAVSNTEWIRRSDGWVARVDLRVQNVGLDPISVSATNFELDHVAYDWKETARCDEPFLSQELDQSDVARGWIAFKVSAKTKLELKVVGIENCFTDSKYVFESYP